MHLLKSFVLAFEFRPFKACVKVLQKTEGTGRRNAKANKRIRKYRADHRIGYAANQSSLQDNSDLELFE